MPDYCCFFERVPAQNGNVGMGRKPTGSASLAFGDVKI
jgi:hypothetical protein